LILLFGLIFFRSRETSASQFLKNNLSTIIIATCPVIIQQVLQGIVSPKEFKFVNGYLDALRKLTNSPYGLSVEAALLYRELRSNDITVRKRNACLIAVYTINNGVRLLHDDKDFTFIAQYSNPRHLKSVDYILPTFFPSPAYKSSPLSLIQ
jgi:predicted nucleic acid-binding protein